MSVHTSEPASAQAARRNRRQRLIALVVASVALVIAAVAAMFMVKCPDDPVPAGKPATTGAP